jgi:hypothetical protein
MLIKKCNKKPVTLPIKKAIFCTKLGAETAIFRMFARMLHAYFCLDSRHDASENHHA